MIGLIKGHFIIRFLVLAMKIVPIYFLPIVLSPEEIGKYGAVLGVVYSLMVVSGFELWFVFNRKYGAASSKRQRLAVLSNQFSHYFLSAPVAVLLLLLAVFEFGLGIAFCSAVILLLYHFSQELIRVLVLNHLHFEASVAQFLQGAWVFFLPFGLISNAKDALLFTLLFAALSFASLVFVFRGRGLFSLAGFIRGLRFSRRLSFSSCVSLVVIAVLFKVVMFAPRWVLLWTGQADLAGVVTYFQSVSAGVTYFSFYFVQSIFLPKMLNESKDEELKKVLFGRFILANLVVTIAVALIILIGCYIYFYYILESGIYLDAYPLLVVVTVAVALTSISTNFSHRSYVGGDDVAYKKSTFFSFLAFAAFLCLSLQWGGAFYVCLSLLVHAAVLFVFRYYFSLKSI